MKQVMVQNNKIVYGLISLISLLYLGLAIKEYWEGNAMLLTVFFNGLVPLFIILWLVSKGKTDTSLKYVILSLFTVYIFVLYQIVLSINFGVYFTYEYRGNHYIMEDSLNIIPFKTIIDPITTPVFVLAKYIQVAGNLFLLTPFAFALRYFNISKSNKNTIIILFFTSISIEIIQFLHTYIDSGFTNVEGRAADIDDLILNTLGAAIGVIVFNVIKRNRKLTGSHTVNK